MDRLIFGVVVAAGFVFIAMPLLAILASILYLIIKVVTALA